MTISFTFPEAVGEVSNSPHPRNNYFCDYNHLSGCEVVLHYSFDLYFLALNNIEHFYVLNDYLYVFIRHGKFSTIVSPNTFFLSFSLSSFILLLLLYVCWYLILL